MKMKTYLSCTLMVTALTCVALPSAFAKGTPNTSVLQVQDHTLTEGRATPYISVLRGERNYLTGYPANNVDGTINVVVEIPAGQTAKFEVNKETGMLQLEQREGKPHFVEYLGYPGNYGIIPRTILPKEQGGDSMDVLVLGPAVPIGSVVKARPIGALALIDGGEKDYKILMVKEGTPMDVCDSVQCLDEKFPGVTTIIKTWFTSYEGRDDKGNLKSEAKGFLNKATAIQLVGDSILAYQNSLVTEGVKKPLDEMGNPQLHYWPASKNNGFKYAGKLAVGAGKMDKLYGSLSLPSFIKHYEIDESNKILMNPYLQVSTEEHPLALDPEIGVYNFIVNAVGEVAIIQEAKHPRGRVYKNGFLRPEDGSLKKVKVKKGKKKYPKEKFGHTSATGGGVARIAGEILFEDGVWLVNNKSGRYSKKKLDGGPEQLANAAKLIRKKSDPAGKPWGPVRFHLSYGTDDIIKAYEGNPEVRYLNPEKKSKPYIEVQVAN